MLDAADIPFLALDLDVAKVLAARREGRRVLYGDASDPRVLDLAGTGRAAALVVTLDRPGAAERIVATVRSFYPGATIVARAHDEVGSERLERLGATVVVPETLELSLIIGEAVLQRLCVPEPAAAAAAEVLRRYHRRGLG
jgi:voltage-gated potassium channel Kch